MSLGGYDQIGRVLRGLVKEGKLIKLGYGLYAKTRLNRITGNPMLDAEGGFEQVAKEALQRLRVAWKDSNIVEAYQKGFSTQIPTSLEIIIKERFNRKISHGRLCLKQVKA